MRSEKKAIKAAFGKAIRSFITCVLCAAGIFASAQNSRPFVLKGSINTDTGTATLLAIADTAFYLSQENKEYPIDKGHFTITGELSYPSAYKIGVKQNSQWQYISDVFILESGEQEIYCNIDSSREIPKINNESTRILAKYQIDISELKEDTAGTKKDSILHRLAFNNRNSFVSMWLIIGLLHGGYRQAFGTTFSELSPIVKRSKPGTTLTKRLEFARKLNKGNKFPKLTFVDTALRKIIAPDYPLHKQYILVDFWFSHCTPCLRQFPEYAELYKAYKDKLEIIAISTDNKAAVEDWKRVISEKKLPWQQFLDVNNISRALSIQYFPTNFLLDGEGNIIKRDIAPKQLRELLEQN